MKREAGSGIKSWELTDDSWEQVKGFVPQQRRDENRTCRRKPGAGRKPIPPRKGHIRGWGEEREEKETKFVARRWAVEVCHSWMNRFRKLPVRYEKKAGNYRAPVEFACAVIVRRNLIPVHPGLIPG
jgi:hypothetical protein